MPTRKSSPKPDDDLDFSWSGAMAPLVEESKKQEQKARSKPVKKAAAPKPVPVPQPSVVPVDPPPQPVKPVLVPLVDIKEVMDEAFAVTSARPRTLSKDQQKAELDKCRNDILYFANTYCYIQDKVAQDWIRLKLWPSQEEAILLVLAVKYSIFLKARQMGWTWLFGDIVPLWKMLFHPIAKVLVFSQRDDDAMELIERVKGTHQRLPEWMRRPIIKSNDHELVFDNESGMEALPATAAGRSRAATYIFIDEADYVADLVRLLKGARPIIEDGPGQLVMLSTVNEETPGSAFQTMFKAAMKGETEWAARFYGWRAHPGRSQDWYDRLVKSTEILEGTLDSVYKEFPETVEQALAERSTNKRFPPNWIRYFTREMPGKPLHFGPVLPGLVVFKEPQEGRKYALGADPAEGMQSSDDSVVDVVDIESNEEVAVWAGKIEPETLADGAAELAAYYNSAVVNPERNNHGILFIRRMTTRHSEISIHRGRDNNPGWHTSYPSKVELYTNTVSILQMYIKIVTREGEIQLDPDALPKLIHSEHTARQLTSIESATANKAPTAPQGFHDDYATAFVLAQQCTFGNAPSLSQSRYTGLYPSRDSREGAVAPVVEGPYMMSYLKGIATPPQHVEPPPFASREQSEQERYRAMVNWTRNGGPRPK